MEEFWKLFEQSRKGKDEVGRELAEDLAKAAVRYANYRMDWNFLSIEERAEQDKYRTSSHNRFIDALNIFLRYERQHQEDVPDIEGRGRKEVGDIACYLAYRLSLETR